LFKGLLLQ